MGAAAVVLWRRCVTGTVLKNAVLLGAYIQIGIPRALRFLGAKYQVVVLVLRYQGTLIATSGNTSGICTGALARAIPHETALIGYAVCPALARIVALGSSKA